MVDTIIRNPLPHELLGPRSPAAYFLDDLERGPGEAGRPGSPAKNGLVRVRLRAQPFLKFLDDGFSVAVTKF